MSFKNKKNEAFVWDIISRNAKTAGITIYEYANSGNHLHLLIRAKHRDDYRSFIRAITGVIARYVSGRERGVALRTGANSNKPSLSTRANRIATVNCNRRTDKSLKFWDGRPFSRIVSFARREFAVARTYLVRNVLETLGWLPYLPRNRQLPQDVRQWLMISTANRVSGAG